MQTELIQLLQHEDYNNVKLGIYIAIANGYNAIDIVDNMCWNYPYCDDNTYAIIKHNDLLFRKMIYNKTSFWFFNMKIFGIRLWNYDGHLDNEDDVLIWKRNKTYTKYAQHFIDLILASD